MKKRRIFIIITVFVLILSINNSLAEPVLHETTADTYGTCYTTYVSTSQISNGGNGWYRFKFTPTTEILYTPSTNAPMMNGHYYGYARPRGLDGKLYGTALKIYYSHTTTWIPNDSGSAASTAKFTIYNGIYVITGQTNTTMTIPVYSKAQMLGTYYTDE